MLEVFINSLIGVEVLLALILCFLIMIQRSKSGGGLGGISGGGATEEVLGAGGAGIVVRLTIIFGCVFLSNTLLIAVLQAHHTAVERASGIDELLPEASAAEGDSSASGTETLPPGISVTTEPASDSPSPAVEPEAPEADTAAADPAPAGDAPEMDEPLPAPAD